VHIAIVTLLVLWFKPLASEILKRLSTYDNIGGILALIAILSEVDKSTFHSEFKDYVANVPPKRF
jgi:hypothetical protein